MSPAWCCIARAGNPLVLPGKHCKVAVARWQHVMDGGSQQWIRLQIRDGGCWDAAAAAGDGEHRVLLSLSSRDQRLRKGGLASNLAPWRASTRPCPPSPPASDQTPWCSSAWQAPGLRHAMGFPLSCLCIHAHVSCRNGKAPLQQVNN